MRTMRENYDVIFIRAGNSYKSAAFNRLQSIKKCLVVNIKLSQLTFDHLVTLYLMGQYVRAMLNYFMRAPSF